MRLTPLTTPLAVLSVLALTPVLASATEYRLTVSGPYRSSTNDAAAFDGTDTTPLAPLFNIPRLIGGTFSASYTFTPPPTFTTGNTVSYNSPASTFSFTLFDPAGALVHHAQIPLSPNILVFNDNSTPFGPLDLLNFQARHSDTSNLQIPPSLYTPTYDLFPLTSSIGFSGTTSPSTNYLSDLSVPTDLAVYQSFPNSGFTTGAIFGEGDIDLFEEPYQYIETQLRYDITSLSLPHPHPRTHHPRPPPPHPPLPPPPQTPP